MNKYKVLFFAAMISMFVVACSQKESQDTTTEEQTSEATADPNEWPQMDSFHMIMAEAFHPYKDSTNLEPVKKLAEELAQEAEKWAGTSLPDKVNNDDMKAKIQQLKTDTRALADKIKGGATDEEIGTSLNGLHDSFHAIMEAWNGGGENHEHEH